MPSAAPHNILCIFLQAVQGPSLPLTLAASLIFLMGPCEAEAVQEPGCFRWVYAQIHGSLAQPKPPYSPAHLRCTWELAFPVIYGCAERKVGREGR